MLDVFGVFVWVFDVGIGSGVLVVVVAKLGVC